MNIDHLKIFWFGSKKDVTDGSLKVLTFKTISFAIKPF